MGRVSLLFPTQGIHTGPTRQGHRGKGGKWEKWEGREEAAGELAPSKHLGFIVLGVRPTSWKSLGRPRELLWGARTGTGIGPAALLGALGLQQGEALLLVLGLQTGKLSPCFLSV